MSITDAQLLAWVQHYFWTFTRIGGVLMTAPVLGSMHASRRVRLMLALVLTIVIAPLTPATAAQELFSAGWILITLQQFVIGVAMGFVLMLAFEAVVMGGEIISYGMGLSFAQLADPVRGVSTPVIGQFLMVLATLLAPLLVVEPGWRAPTHDFVAWLAVELAQHDRAYARADLQQGTRPAPRRL